MKVIYADSIFFINAAINYLILLISAKICDIYVKRWKIVIGALIGGVYAVFSEFPDFEFLKSPLIKAVAAIIMILAVFRPEKVVRPGIVFFSVSAAFAGAVLAIGTMTGNTIDASGIYINIDFKILVLSFAVSYAAISLVFKRAGKRVKSNYVKVEIRNSDKKVTFTALIDTGNSLSDPVTGAHVMVTEADKLKGLFGKDTEKILNNLSTLNADELMMKLSETEREIKFRLIPYSAVGIGRGMLVAMKPEHISLDGKKQDRLLVAISPTKVSDGGAYSALVNI